MSEFYNRLDPRFDTIRNIVRHSDALDLDGYDRPAHVYQAYRDHADVNRAAQAAQGAYENAIQLATQSLNPAPANVLWQAQGGGPILINQIAASLNAQPTSFVHIVRVQVDAATRLYIPCNLASVGHFFPLLWAYPALKAFKVVGYEAAVSRPDVIVAWFQHNQHARTVGQLFDQNHATHMSGTFPIGAFPCSAANLCGWAPEVGSSVGIDATTDLGNRNLERALPREAPL
jgi:hypothetical protein